MFFLALKNSFYILIQNWRKLLMPSLCITFILWICIVVGLEFGVYHQRIGIGARGLLLLLISFVTFLMKAGFINLLRRFLQNKSGGWRDVFQGFSWRQLRRLLAVFTSLYFCMFAICALLLLLSLEAAAIYILAFMIPIQFYAILTLLENPEHRSSKCLYLGFRETIFQRWEMWVTWILAGLSYRVIGRGAWVLTWWVPNKLAGLNVQGYWIILCFILLMSCVSALGVLLLLSLREMRQSLRNKNASI